MLCLITGNKNKTELIPSVRFLSRVCVDFLEIFQGSLLLNIFCSICTLLCNMMNIIVEHHLYIYILLDYPFLFYGIPRLVNIHS